MPRSLGAPPRGACRTLEDAPRACAASSGAAIRAHLVPRQLVPLRPVVPSPLAPPLARPLALRSAPVAARAVGGAAAAGAVAVPAVTRPAVAAAAVAAPALALPREPELAREAPLEVARVARREGDGACRHPASVGRCGEMRGDAGRCGEMRGGAGEIRRRPTRAHRRARRAPAWWIDHHEGGSVRSAAEYSEHRVNTRRTQTQWIRLSPCPLQSWWEDRVRPPRLRAGRAPSR